MKKGTTTNLIEDLKTKTDTPFRTIIIARAENGDYHDFKSELPMPKILLHRDATICGYEDIAQKSMEGEYDELC